MKHITYFNRYTKKFENESVCGENFLRWLYNSKYGNVLLKFIVKNKWFSYLCAKRMHKQKSKKYIFDFIKKYSIDMEEFEKSAENFVSFNDFFVRKLKIKDNRYVRKIDDCKNSIIFPADARHFGFQNFSEQNYFDIKNESFHLETFLNNKDLASKYSGGTVVISRLCPSDYHRFHFPTDGIPFSSKLINGSLFSVNPIAIKKSLKIFSENKRVLTLFDTKNVGTVLIVEIGATFIGSIVQTFIANSPVQKGDEKGFFEFGGSTIVTIFEPGKVVLSDDLVNQTKNGYELYAKFGDVLGFSNI